MEKDQVNKYHIGVDRANRLIRMRWTNPFWSIEDFEEFKTDLARAFIDLNLLVEESCVLVDACGAMVQSQEVFEGIRQMTVNSKANKIAFVVTKPLLTLQTRRLGMRENVRIFTSVNEAEHWLMAS